MSFLTRRWLGQVRRDEIRGPARRRKASRVLRTERLEDRRLLSASHFFGLGGGGLVLSRFDDTGAVSGATAITGLNSGDFLVDIDHFTSGDAQLYGLGDSGALYTIDTATAVATVDVEPPYNVDIGTPTAMDFNPFADRLRIFSGTENYRLTPGTGVVTDDGTLAYAVGDVNEGDTPNLRGAAYTNNFDLPPTTLLYSIDVDQNALVLHTAGPQFSLLTTVADLTLAGVPYDIGPDVGFDIFTDRSNPETPANFAYVSDGDLLYEVSLTGATAGELTLLGTVGAGAGGLTDITADPGLLVFGTDGDDTLIVTATAEDTGSYSLNGAAAVAFSGIHAFLFYSGAGDDTLRIINPPASLFAPADGIVFDGQADLGDRLELEGGGGATFDVVYHVFNVDTGVYTTSNGATQAIAFTGVEAVQDTVLAGGVAVELTGEDDEVTVEAGAIVTNSDFLTGIVTTVIGDGPGGTLADLTFANKLGVYVAGEGGDDAFTFEGASLGDGSTNFEFDGGAGFNRAFLNGSNATDTAQLSPTLGTLESPDYDVAAHAIAEFYVDSGGGPGERADLFDSAGDDQLASFPTYSHLSGAGFRNEVEGFDSVYAFASLGTDRANLSDSAGNDRLLAFPTYANLRGSGFRNEAVNFDSVFAVATAGNDRAEMTGSASNDTFVASPTQARLQGAAFFNSAAGFDAVYAKGGGGSFDTAQLFDSAQGDFFFGSSAYSYVRGAGFRNEVSAFDQVFTHASAGADRAELRDSAGSDELFGRDDFIELGIDLDYFLRVDGLDSSDRVTAISSNGGVDTSDVSAVDYTFQQIGPWVNV